ncbi:hypothetical protein, partial [Burkholderia gladioli]|uniref:hypothetical protein n=1 Tax=Burkholderia gladioli TaxID=28095 RepID=UPI001C612AC9
MDYLSTSKSVGWLPIIAPAASAAGDDDEFARKGSCHERFAHRRRHPARRAGHAQVGGGDDRDAQADHA